MDWNDMQTWQYGAIIGGAVLVVGLVVYFLPVRRLKIPGGVTAAMGGMALGLAAGILWMAVYGYKPLGPAAKSDGSETAKADNKGKGNAKGGGKAGGKGGGFVGGP